MIASDTRFKAATSGAGTGFTIALYGVDQYIMQYDDEIGPPWNPKAWRRIRKFRIPFLHADRIKTPTLFLGGEQDFNVPVHRRRAKCTRRCAASAFPRELIIYPNESHGIQRPSYQRDRIERYLAWYAKYLKNSSATGHEAVADDK